MSSVESIGGVLRATTLVAVTSWEERIGSTAAWQSAENARARLEELRDAHSGSGVLGRPSRLVELTLARLRLVDPELAVPSALQGLAQRLDEMVTAVEGHLEPPEGQTPVDDATIDGAADKVAQSLGSLPSAGSEEAVAIADVYRRELGDVESRVAALVNEARESVAESTTDHSQTLEQRKNEAAQLAERMSEIEAQVSALRTSVDEFIAERTTAAETAANEAKTAHDTQRQRAREETEALVSGAKESFETEATRQREAHQQLIESLDTKANEHLNEIEEMKAQVERLVGAVGRTGLSAGFQQWEASEREQADKMRTLAIRVGIAAALAVIGLLVARLWAGLGDGDELALSVGALSIPAALGGVAVYAGRESGRHRRNQIIARRTELELASFHPYIAELGDDEQAELTALFAPVFFGQSTAHTAAGRDEKHGGPQSLTKEVLDRLAEIVKSRRQPAE